MTRLDWLVTRRIFSRIALAVLVFFSLISLVESLDSWRFSTLSQVGGPQLAILAIITNALKWTIRTLSVTVLLGTIIGVLDLQARRELTVIKATGISIWQVLRLPLLMVALCSLGVGLVADGINTEINRGLNPSPPGAVSGLADGDFWLEQRGDGANYIITADRATDRGTTLNRVVVFMRDAQDGTRLEAESARLASGHWELANVQRLRPDAPAESLPALSLPTSSTAADLGLKLTSSEDFTFAELAAALATSISDPAVRAAAATRYFRLLTLPLLLAGSVLIAFAFTAGYRRTHKYGAAVLYGIILGFVVFVLTEMADRAGSAGVLEPGVAAVGPAFVAIVIGVTVLLHKEDGRA